MLQIFKVNKEKITYFALFTSIIIFFLLFAIFFKNDAEVNKSKEIDVAINHEDLISNPSEELKKIGDFAEVDLSPISDIISHGDVIEKGHSVAGNKLRMQTNIRMKPDTEWIHRLSSLEKRVFWLLTGWLMQRYGYTK